MNIRALFVAAVAALFGFAAQAKDYTPDIVDDTIVFGEITEDSTITIASGETVTSSTAIIGSGKLSVGGGGTLVLSAASSDYSGEIYIGNATVEVTTGYALGTGKVTIQGFAGASGGTDTTAISQLRFSTGSTAATFPNAIDIETASAVKIDGTTYTTSHLFFNANTAIVTLDGKITAQKDVSISDTHSSNTDTIYARFTNDITAQSLATFDGWCGYQFDGKVTVSGQFYAIGAVSPNHMTKFYLYSSENSLGYLQVRRGAKIVAKAENVYGGGYLTWRDSGATGGYPIGKFDQTIAYVKRSTSNTGYISADSTVGATLTLTGGVATATATLCDLQGALNITVDDCGAAGTFTQVFAGDLAYSLTGKLTAKRGTLKVTGAAAMPALKAIEVCGGTFDFSSTAANALAGLETLTVSSGTFSIASTATDALPNDGSLVLSLTTGTGARLNLPSGTSLVVDKFIVDGQQKVRATPFTHTDYEEIAEGVEISAVGTLNYTCTESGNIDLAGLLGGASVGCNLTIPAGVTVTNTTAIPASCGALSISGGGTLALGVESSSFAGEVNIVSVTNIISVSNPFGTGAMTIDGLTLLKFVGDNNKTFPNELTVVSSTVDSVVINNTGNGCVTFKGAITATGGLGIGSIRGVNASSFPDETYLVFEKEITCSTSANIRFQMQGAAELHGKVTANTLFAYGGGSKPTLSAPILHFYATNSIGRIYSRWSGKFICEAEGLLAGQTYLEYNNGENGGQFNLKTFDQKIKYVTGAGKDSHLVSISADENEGAALTLSGTGSRVVKNCRLTGGLGLVVDSSNGTLQQTFSGVKAIPHTMTGPIVVKSGAVTFADESTLANVPAINVEGGALNLTTTADGAFAGVKNLAISGGTFTIDGTGADPFGPAASTQTEAAFSGEGRLSLGDGVTATVFRACTNGVYLEAGEYTGADSAANALQLPQLSGNGVLRVLKSGPRGMILFVQ